MAKKTIVKNIAFGCASVVAIGGVGLGAVSFVELAKTEFTGIKAGTTTTQQTSPLLKWQFIGDTVVGYDGVMPEVLKVPASYSLGTAERVEETFSNSGELEEWLMLTQDPYHRVNVGFEENIFNFTFADALGNTTICTSLESLNTYNDSIRELEWTDEEAFLATFPIKVNYEQKPIIEGTDYKVTKMSASFFGAQINQNTMKPENVKEIHLPKSIAEIDDIYYYTFFSNLEKIVVEEGNENFYTTEEGILVDTATNSIRVFPSAITGDYVMPTSLNFTENSGSLFRNSKLTSFTTNNVVSYIPAGLFSNSSIHTIVLGNNVKSLEQSAFNGFQGERVVLNYGLENIGATAFGNAKITNLTIPASVTSIADYAFHRSDLESIVVPSSVTTIGSGIFEFCEMLASATLNAQIDKLPDNTFNECISLTNLHLSDTITQFGMRALYNAGISNLVVNEGVEYIDYTSLGGVSLTVLDLPNTFKGFTYNNSVEANVYNIFDTTDNITTIILRNADAMPRSYDKDDVNTFWSYPKFTEQNITLYVTADLLTTYQTQYASSNYTILDLSTYNS